MLQYTEGNLLIAPQMLSHVGQGPFTLSSPKADWNRTGLPTPWAWFPFLEGAGSVTRDMITGRTVTVPDGVWTNHQLGAGIDPNSDETAVVEIGSDFTPGTGDFTVFARFVIPASFTDSQPVIMGQGDTGAGEWMLRLTGGTDMAFYADAGAFSMRYTPNLSAGIYSAAATRAGTSGGLFLNGARKTADLTAGSNLNTTKQIQVGGADSATGRTWNGVIHEVLLFHHELTVGEIAYLHANEHWVALRDPLEWLMDLVVSAAPTPTQTMPVISSGGVHSPIFQGLVVNG